MVTQLGKQYRASKATEMDIWCEDTARTRNCFKVQYAKYSEEKYCSNTSRVARELVAGNRLTKLVKQYCVQYENVHTV